VLSGGRRPGRIQLCCRLCGRVLFEGGRNMRIRTGALAVLAAAIVPLLSATSAGAAGAGAVGFTQHFHNEVLFSDHDVNPCTGAPGTVTATAKNGVFHITTLANGTSWATSTFEGTITFVPDNPAAPSGSGHFGTDGSRVGVHEVFHMSTSASGGSITFDKPHMTCS
jgi:hypothetical protein